tara:strand:- start:256 stop:579 length:324 start_codon:yes stop_codon:yes gene_type:complete
MTKWDEATEEELTLLIKDWLKQQGKTQADLKTSLEAISSRMPALIDALKKEYYIGGLPQLARKLCFIEETWSKSHSDPDNKKEPLEDPFGQLDLLVKEIKEDLETST